MISIVPSEIVSKVNVPVKVGPAKSDLLAIATAILSNSTSNSDPRMILSGSPVFKVSFTAKSVVLV